MFQLLALTILLALALPLGLMSQNCSPILMAGVIDDKIPKLETGSLSLQHSEGQSSSKRFHYYPVTLKGIFGNNFQVALSIIYIDNYCPITGVDFAARPIFNGSQTFTAAIIMSKSSLWTSAHLHYLVTSRSDFRAGFFIPDENQLLGFSSKQNSLINFKMSYHLGNVQLDPIFYRGRIRSSVFLSGLKSEDSQFNFEIRSLNNFEAAKRIIEYSLTVKEALNPIQIVYISYLLYSDQNQFLTSIIANVPSYVSQILKGQQVVQLTFSGMTGVRGVQLKGLQKCKNKRRLLTGISPQLENIKAFTGSFNIQGITIKDNILGSLSTQGIILKFAPISLRDILSQNGCVNRKVCEDYGGKSILLRNGTSACVLCGNGKYFDYLKQQCLCLQGKILSDDGQKCLSEEQKCGIDGIFKQGFCFKCETLFCQQPYYFNATTKQCLCDQQKGYESITINNEQKCLQKCPQFSFRNKDTGKCQCIVSNQYISKQTGLCTSCAAGKRWNSIQNKCSCRPPLLQKYDGTCIYCSVNGYYDSQKQACLCNVGYIGNGSVCKKMEDSPAILGDGIIIFQNSFIPAN